MRVPLGLWLGLLLTGCWNFDALQNGYGKQPDLLGQHDASTDTFECLADCSNCPDSPTCKTITGLFGYGVPFENSSCPNGQMANGGVFYDKPTLGTTCSACSCDAPDGCSYPIQYYQDNNCNTKSKSDEIGAACGKLDPDKQYTLGSPTLSCKPGAATVAPDPGWTMKGQLCLGSLNRASCTNVSCISLQADAMPGTRFCIALTQANDTCPAAFPVKDPAPRYSYTDGRSCACTCDSPAGATCNGPVTFYDDSSCMMNPQQVMTNACSTSPGSSKYAQFKYMQKGGDQCTAGGTIQGSAGAVTTLSLCCNM
jgi:hypothetical protein